MAKRILLAGVVGGLVMFVWGAISHMVLPLGEVGVRQIDSNEETVLTAMRSAIREPGFYFFPAMDHSSGMSKEQQEAAMKKWEEKYRAGPWGVLIYHPQGSGQALSPKQLIGEGLSNIAAVLVAAILLSKAVGGLGGFGGRVLFVALLGLLPSLAIDFSYWNWYGFPTNYSLAVAADQLIGFTLAGLVLAAFVKPPAG